MQQEDTVYHRVWVVHVDTACEVDGMGQCYDPAPVDCERCPVMIF